MSVRRQEGGTHAAEDFLQVRTVRIIGHGGVQVLSYATCAPTPCTLETLDVYACVYAAAALPTHERGTGGAHQ